jgi:hypothetical protein
VEKARERAAGLSDTSPDRDRIAAHLKAPTGTVRRAPGCPLLVVIDDAADPSRGDILIAEFSAGRRRGRVFRTAR